jgi:WD40 repeat protein
MKTANVLVTSSADGWLKHWHATSGKCLHSRQSEDNPENHLYAIDYSNDGTLLATGGKDKYVRLYDE